ncbi:unnamed protein product [Clavelina lepadiformis]|uniref:Uncharacterized protein n=1 Tax=Clavelina lepadiformis TaxID=159417 RepID=A0ABP0GBT7_CLALP
MRVPPKYTVTKVVWLNTPIRTIWNLHCADCIRQVLHLMRDGDDAIRRHTEYQLKVARPRPAAEKCT